MNKERTIEEIYQKKTPLEHILLRPDTYIGSIETQKDKLWVFDRDTQKLVFKEITYVPGLYKIFDEILVNAADNFQRDKSMTYIKVSINQEQNEISVRNDGKGIQVVIHKEHDCYVPELIFGHLLTSSNYDDNQKKVVGGRNGYGAKLTNIFSKRFVVETSEKTSGKYFKQVYKSNMSSKSSPEIRKCEKEDYTCITFEPDLEKFKMKKLDDDIVSLMIKRVYDMAGITPSCVKVYLNDKKLEVKNFSSYIDMYLDSIERDEEEVEVNKVYEKPNDYWEVGMYISDGQFQQVSYTNAICTSKGGTHVNYVADQIVQHIIEFVKKKHKNLELKPHQVKQHLWIFVNALIVNPSFDSQTKETLTLKPSSFGSTCELSEKFLKDVLKTGVIEHVVNFAKTREDLKMLKNLNGGVKKTSRLFGIPKLEDANKAGTKDSQECTLILTEGDSAKSLAMSGIEVVGRDEYGVFPLKGKLLNVRDATNNQIIGNEEIQNLFKIIGLQIGKVYSSNKELRYGSIMIMTDQDTDGSHIKGLIINFIHHFWPSLVKLNGFVKQFITPIIKATKGNNIKSFYTIPEYKAWADQQGPSIKSWKVKYYKGLGTSTTKEAKEYFKAFDSSRILFDYQNNEDDECIDLVFNKKRTEDRKKWLSEFNYNNALQDHNYRKIRYQDFINKEFILFSIADNERSIPSVCDGLKPSERKILYACFKRKLKDEIKVAQLSGYIAEHSAYHHGEMSLCKTIVSMAQNFVGSNNINLLMPNGMFGTRNQGGNDSASSRYIYTCLNRVSRHIFNENDDNLLTNIIEEGQKIEPHWYLPVIPMILVNGAEGIGTGWSTSVPCYNPREIVKNLIQKMKGGEFFEMTPWYKGFTGTIEKMENGGYLISGKYELNLEENTVIITELPVKKWTKDYKSFLEKAMGIVVKSKKDKKDETKKKKKSKEEKEKEEEEKQIKIFVEDVREYHKSNRVHFEVRLTKEAFDEIKKDEAKAIKKMKLSTTMQISNIVCFNHEKKIKKYSNIEEILNEFYEIRLIFYEMRKEHMLKVIAKDLEILENKVRFIMAIINEEIIIRKAKKKDLISILFEKKFTPMSKINKLVSIKGSKEEEVLEIKNSQEETEVTEENTVIPAKEYDYLLTLPLWSLTYERVQELLNQRQSKEQEMKNLKATPVIDLWIRDLEKFLEVLDEVEAIEEEERRMDDENNEFEKGKKKKGKGKQKKEKKEKEEKMEEEKEKKTKKNSLNGNDKKNNKTIDNMFNKTSQKEVEDPLKMTLQERLAKKISSQDKPSIDSNLLRASQDMNFHNTIVKRKAVIDDEDDYITNYGKTNKLEEDKNEEAKDKKKKFGKTNQTRKQIVDDNDETENTSYRF